MDNAVTLAVLRELGVLFQATGVDEAGPQDTVLCCALRKGAGVPGQLKAQPAT